MSKDLWRSRDVITAPEHLGSRALMKSMGFTDDEIRKPRIAVANSWTELCPGHFHLKSVAEAVRAGIWQAGGVPYEFSSFAQCPVVVAGSGLHGSRYDTPSRDILAAEVEAAVEQHLLDAMVLICSCDKNVPGHLLAAARLNIPCIIVTGGTMISGKFKGRKVTANDAMVEGRSIAMGVSKLSEKEAAELEDEACPGPGACGLLGTANTMQCLVEALGMALPGSVTAPAMSAKRLRIAKESGKQVMNLLKAQIRPSDIMTVDALRNAITVLHAIGGSSNAILHLLALAEELNQNSKINIDLIGKLGKETPCITDVLPSGKYDVADLDEAGGIIAVMKRLNNRINTKVMTVTQKTLEENLQGIEVKRDEVIRKIDNPVNTEGLCVLRGNLAHSAVIRTTVVVEEMRQHTGPARVFDSIEDTLKAIKGNKINPGDVIVIRYEGPRGGPGTTSVYGVISWLKGLGLLEKCVVVTDGKVSGFCTGPIVVQVVPEAAVGGPLAIVEEGDLIKLDIPGGRLDLKISEVEIEKRLRNWKPKEPRVKKGFLTVYSQIALQSDRGAGLGTGYERE